ncbi:MAG: SMC family ATPase [Actinobacteria bacterium]|nr:SMC family ATPase [Actinomycetota bacterium]
MRPLRIRAEGFSAYRSAVELDLEGVEFFSLSGPTGSGKSSLVDAMIFALFGRVPRLGGNAVGPAISAGAVRARVAVDFDVGGVAYTAVRMAERTKSGGATVKEARLQRGDKVLADGADDVTREVENLLSLRFDDFTRTVVLPQGEFARFLTSPKAERQSLLRNLLGLDVYSMVRSLAKTRESVAGDRASVARRQLDAIELPDEEIVEELSRRLDGLDAIAKTIVADERRLTRLDSDCEAERKEVDRLEGSLLRLTEIEPPDRIDELDQLAAGARERLADAESALEEARGRSGELEAKVASLASVDEIEAHRKSHVRLGEIVERLARHDPESARARVTVAESEMATAGKNLEEIRSRLASSRVSHAAHALTATLIVGEPCPVCDHEVLTVPSRPSSSEVSELEADEVSAGRVVNEAQTTLDEAKKTLTQMETSYSVQKTQHDELAIEMRAVPSLDDLRRMEEEVAGLTSDLASCRDDVVRRKDELNLAGSALEDLADSVRRVGKDLTAAQLRVADLVPPVPESDDVIVQWKELMLWRDEVGQRLTAERAGAEVRVKEAKARALAARDGLAAKLANVDVPAVEPFAVQVASELEVARQKTAAVEKARRDATEFAKVSHVSESEQEVAAGLANHLRANGFERWLMVGAMADLVAGANDLLSQLSDGGYSLNSDDEGTFSIVDHRNANETRSVSTLSGGETFLVSLALALSLAETLAAAGGADLDAIILDEGFGTLDDESLDTVASVLEDLAGRGLVVGVITHVKELASRAPVRFVVSSEPAGSKVVRVS